MRKDTKVRPFNVKNEKSGEFVRFYFENGKRYLTLEGVYHHNMVTRATNPNYKNRYPTYSNVTLCSKFSDFQYFAKWCNTQKGFGNIGWCLDKDVISDSQVYSENTCVFIPPLINSYFATSKVKRELPLGVSWSSSENCYKAYCSQLNGKNKTLGRFEFIEDAANAYIKYKSSLAKDLISLYKDELDNRVISKLNNIYETGEYR